MGLKEQYGIKGIKEENLVCTLDADIRPGRRMGNSTRQRDFAIDKLYKGKTVIVIDHHDSVSCNNKLLREIVDELYISHKEHIDNFIITREDYSTKNKLITITKN